MRPSLRDNTTTMWKAAAFGATVGVSFVACTFTRSLDYLQNGGPITTDGGNDAPISSSSGGTDGTAPPFEGFVKAQFDPKHVTLDADTIYWSTGDGAIMAAPKATGEARKLGSVNAGTQVTWLAADPGNGTTGNLYVVSDRELKRIPKAGGDLTLVEKDIVKPNAVVVDDTNLFVAHYDENGAQTGNVARFTKDGMNRVEISLPDDDPNAVAIQGGSVFWPGLSAVDSVGVIYEAPKNVGPDAGASATVHKASNGDIAVDQSDAFAVDADAIYYFAAPSVMRLGRVGNPAATIVFDAPTGTDFVAFAVDDANVFVAELRADGAVLRCPKTGGVPATLAANKGTAPTSIAVDDQYVYFTVEGSKRGPDGAIVRVSKK